MADINRHKKGEMPVVTREIYKNVKKFDRERFTGFCSDLYKYGFEDGRESVPGIEVEDIYEVIASVKGIGPKKLEEIKVAVEAAFGKKEKKNEECERS